MLEHLIAPWGLTPDFAFLLVFWIAIRRGKLPALFWGLAIGLLRDLADFELLGASSLALSVSGYFLGAMRDRVDRDNLAIRVMLFALGSLIAQALFLPMALGGSPAFLFLEWLKRGLPGMALNLFVYLLILGVVFIARGGLQRFREDDDEEF
jgi:rod shape-determining protein MreD